ncbi:MAG TPA: hypothetical protein VGD57_02530, partial [Candidatus Dormibacteraeota bacterium]
CANTNGRNVSVAITTPVRPRFRNSIESWKLHDEQEPQSPRANNPIRYLRVISLIISGGAGWLALLLAI